MRSSRWRLISSLLALTLLACSDTGGTGPSANPTGGSGGKAGKGGAGGAGGAAGQGNTAGTAQGGSDGTSGTSGQGGTFTQGGKGGAAGQAGSGGQAAGQAGQAGQSGGQAGATGCGPSRADCDGKDTNGCEVDLATDAKNCGKCGQGCVSADHADGVCVQGTCTVACQSGYANCDGDPSNGCEAQLSSDVDNCGFCGNFCPNNGTEKGVCLAGSCKLQCEGMKIDCNQNPIDGCETDVLTDVENCGSCGKTCGGGKCVQGACECAGTTAEAKPVQLAMYVMLDKSGSMLDPISSGGTRWEAVKAALGQFFASDQASGIKVALNYFPLQAPGGTACDASYYFTPAVPMAPLPGPSGAQVSALTGSMAQITPSGGTPTQVALAASLGYAAEWKKAFPGDKAIVVLATDGQPGDGCGATLDNSNAAAAAGLAATPSVPTYVIGVGPLTTNLDSIAAAGGTTKSFPVDDGNTAAFLEALKQIKLQAVACEYALPTASGTDQIDYTKVNVEYTPGGGQPTLLPNTDNPGTCGAQGWYYDNANSPTKILLCPSSCTTVQSDSNAKVSIQLGCDTKKD